MSTLATNAITDASGGNTATINSYTPIESNMAGRNKIINGDMRIDQRNAGASVSHTGATIFTLDRFKLLGTSSAGVFSIQQDASAPAGFSASMKITVTTTDTSLTGDDRYNVQQQIEGYNISDFAFGTASAKDVTASFWVRSSVTGTFGGALQNGASDRSYPFTYEISSADTWEYKTVTIPGETTGTWATDSGRGMTLYVALGCGPNRSGTANAWASANYHTATGATNLMATSGATFYLTGVQLEAGSVATPFERRSYGQELALCQRYFFAQEFNATQTWGCGHRQTSNVGRWTTTVPVPMRATPSFSSTATLRAVFSGGDVALTSPSVLSSYGLFVVIEGTAVGVEPSANAYGYGGVNNYSAEL